MRKALIIFLLVLLPFQFVWGAAAGYCQHEQGQAVHHFGHHFHKHSSGDKAKQLIGDDADCVACHVASAPVATNIEVSPAPADVLRVLALVLQDHSRLMVPSIDRPKWAALS